MLENFKYLQNDLYSLNAVYVMLPTNFTKIYCAHISNLQIGAETNKLIFLEIVFVDFDIEF